MAYCEAFMASRQSALPPPSHQQRLVALCQATRGGRNWNRAALTAFVLAGVLLGGALTRAQTSPPSVPAPPATSGPADRAGNPATRPASATVVTPLALNESLEGLPIARVEVTGNTRTDAKVILDQVRSQAGQNYRHAAVDQDVRTIAALERFITVRAEIVPTTESRVVVRFVVQERAVVTGVEIVGNHKKNDEKIREVTSVHPGMGVDPFVIATDIKAIEELYRKDGYNFAKVEVDKKALEDQGIVRYRIQEGPRCRIAQVKFDGNEHMKSYYLKWKIETKSYIWIFRKGVLDEDKLEADLAIIREVYTAKGYLDCRVSRSVEYSPDKTKITVRFAINEGPRYKVGKILVTGNTVFNDADLRSDILLNHDDWAERTKVEASQKHVEDRYGHEGYINRVVDLKSTYTDQPGVVDLQFTVAEGKPYSVRRVIVRGNPNIQDRVIRRQIRVYPDQTYDTVLIRKSTERLKATRLFSDVKISPIGDEPDTRDVLAETQEGQTGKFLIGAGISTNSGVIGQLSLEQNNFDITNTPASAGEFIRGQSFKGAGQYFRILLEPGTQLQRYRVTFEEPYLFDSPYSFSNDIYYFTRGRESYDEQRIGDIVTLGRRFGDIYSTFLAFRGENVDIKNVTNDGPTDVVNITPVYDANGNLLYEQGSSAQEILDNAGNHLITSIKPGLVRDTTDSRIFPTTGNRASVSWEQYGAMGGDVTMSKVTTRFDWYYPLYTDIFNRKTVLAQRNEVGFVPLGDSVFYERFYGGGIGSLRGFKYRGVSPRSGPLNDPVGGDFSWLSTVEINYPIFEEIIRGVVFTDVGTVERDIQINEIRSDIGVGLRLTIPFFGQLPLAVDFAVPISKVQGDQKQFISFSLGIPF